jgi:hypothetical protein
MGPMRNPNRCPSCGEHVSPFAAGCAICGAALDPRRGQTRPLGEQLKTLWQKAGRRRSRDADPSFEQ